MKPDLLKGLHDIHLPEPVSWWPPAIGWWLILLFVILSIVAVFWWLKWRRAQRLKPKEFSRQTMLKQAGNELERLEGLASANASDARTVVAELSALLRRVAVRLKPEDAQIAGLSGEAWVQWLDSQWERDAFVSGPGHALLDAPYQRDGEIDIAALLTLSRQWIEACNYPVSSEKVLSRQQPARTRGFSRAEFSQKGVAEAALPNHVES